MLLERVFDDLEVVIQAFAACQVSPGWRLRLGGPDAVVVHFVHSGSGRLRVAGAEPIAIPRGSLAIVPAQRPHALEAGAHIEHERRFTGPLPDGGGLARYDATDDEMTDEDTLSVMCGLIRARYRTGVGLFDHLTGPIVLDFSDSPAMSTVFERMAEEQRSPSIASHVMMTALMNEALVLIFRRLCEEPECPLPWLTALEDPRLSQPLTLMLEHPERRHTLEDLAGAAAMSRSSFAQAFSERFGSAPMAYLRESRMRRAARLLSSTDMTVDEVAARVGYSSRSQFSRAFSGYFGRSPAAFRRGPAAA